MEHFCFTKWCIMYNCTKSIHHLPALEGTEEEGEGQV